MLNAKTKCIMLGLMSACSVDAIATTDYKFKKKDKLAFSINNIYGPKVTAGGFYGSGDNSYGSLDALLPLLQSQRRLLYFDARGLQRTSSQKELNIGLGYRWLSNDYQRLYGVYSFYDVMRSPDPNNNLFHQLTVGGEFKVGRFSLGINGYLPLGDKQKQTSQSHNYSDPYLESFGTHTQIALDKITQTGYEKILGGFDGEVGFTISKTIGLKAYAGGYYFSADGAQTVAGPRGTLMLNLLEKYSNSSSWRPRLELETSLQHDKPRGTTWYAGARLSISFGAKKPSVLTAMQNEMTSFVRRDLDVVTGSTTASEKEVEYALNDDAKTIRLITVKSQSDLDYAVDSKNSIHVIAVDGTVDVSGSDSSSDVLIPLLDKQILMSGDYSFTHDGETKSIKLASNGVLSATKEGHLVGVAKNNKINNLSLETKTNNADYAAITNLSGKITDTENQIKGDLLNLKVTASDIRRGGIYISTNAKNAIDSIENNTINMSVSGRGAIQLEGVSLTATQNIKSNILNISGAAAAAITVGGDVASNIDSNTINIDAIAQSFKAISVAGSLNAGSISSNTIKTNVGVSLDASTADINAIEITGGLAANAAVNSNTISLSATNANSLIGVLVGDPIATSDANISGISFNGNINSNDITINKKDSSVKGYGVYVNGLAAGTHAGSLQANNITLKGAGILSGMQLNKKSGVDADFSGKIGGGTSVLGNTITSDLTATPEYFISLSGNLIGGIENNILTYQADSMPASRLLRAIVLDGDIGSSTGNATSAINYNTINLGSAASYVSADSSDGDRRRVIALHLGGNAYASTTINNNNINVYVKDIASLSSNIFSSGISNYSVNHSTLAITETYNQFHSAVKDNTINFAIDSTNSTFGLLYSTNNVDSSIKSGDVSGNNIAISALKVNGWYFTGIDIIGNSVAGKYYNSVYNADITNNTIDLDIDGYWDEASVYGVSLYYVYGDVNIFKNNIDISSSGVLDGMYIRGITFGNGKYDSAMAAASTVLTNFNVNNNTIKVDSLNTSTDELEHFLIRLTTVNTDADELNSATLINTGSVSNNILSSFVNVDTIDGGKTRGIVHIAGDGVNYGTDAAKMSYNSNVITIQPTGVYASPYQAQGYFLSAESAKVNNVELNENTITISQAAAGGSFDSTKAFYFDIDKPDGVSYKLNLSGNNATVYGKTTATAFEGTGDGWGDVGFSWSGLGDFSQSNNICQKNIAPDSCWAPSLDD